MKNSTILTDFDDLGMCYLQKTVIGGLFGLDAVGCGVGDLIKQVLL